MTKLLLRDAIELEYSGSLKEMSLLHWNSDQWIGGHQTDDQFVTSGYSSLVQAYAKDQGLLKHVILNAPVKTVNYETTSGEQEVLVTYRDEEEKETTIRAKKLIITVPLGVLQAKSIQFVPDLPTSTANAIQRLGMGKMNKILMVWSSANDIFWPSVEKLADVTDRDSNFEFYNSLSLGDGEQKPALFAFFKGTLVEEVERKYAKTNPQVYKEKICELAMESLRSMFGNDISNPETVVVTNWNVDEYSMGTYSYNKVGMKEQDRQVLASPIAGNRIFIAGEATHNRYFATTTGAFLTGRAAAKTVVKTLKKEARRNKLISSKLGAQ